MSPEDDSMWDGDMRASSVFTRYHVGVGTTLLETFRRKADAFEFAVRHWNKGEGEPVGVFDSMAREGGAEFWLVQAASPEIKLGTPIRVPPARRKTSKGYAFGKPANKHENCDCISCLPHTY